MQNNEKQSDIISESIYTKNAFKNEFNAPDQEIEIQDNGESINLSKNIHKNKAIHQLVEERAFKSQGDIAIIDTYNNTNLTYTDLLRNCIFLSAYICDLVKTKHIKNPLIAVLSGKGSQQVVGAISAMQSGHAYLPLNIEWPLARIKEVLEQGTVRILLISSEQYARTEIKDSLSQKYILIVIEDVLNEILSNPELKHYLAEVTLPVINSDDIAYVIFTSGSTGKPKGVTISHRGAINTIDAVNEKFKISSHDKILALSELSFDLSVYDIFGILIAGGTVIFPQQERIRDTIHWVELIKKYEITIWNTVPQLADLLIDEIQSQKLCINSLRLFMLSGDWIPLNLPQKIKKYCPKSRVISLGGATEGSIWSIWYEIDEIHPHWVTIPYGFAMPNQQMYILGEKKDSLDLEEIGEIYIGGDGVALDYWNDTIKTNLSFINHNKFGRIYKTGDLGKMHKDGYIEFIGRKDNQVKINGYRVELEEITAKILTLFNVDNAVTLMKVINNINYIITYYISNESLDVNLVKLELQKLLPDYMVPSAYIALESFPLTSNGKLDREKFPDPEFINIRRNSYMAPRDEIEKNMSIIWGELLGITASTISITDDFFMLGGNSILAIKLISKLNKLLMMKLTVNDLFINKTIQEFVCNSIKKSIGNNLLSSDLTIRNDIQSMSTIENGILNHLLLIGLDSVTYNESFTIDLFNQSMSLTNLQTQVNKVVDSIELLHSNYYYVDNHFVRKINKSDIICKEVVIQEDFDKEATKLAQIPFNIEKDKLIRIYLIHQEIHQDVARSTKVFIVFSHLIGDATSMINILIPQLMDVNHEIKNNCQSEYLNAIYAINQKYSENHSHKLSYWQDKLQDVGIIGMQKSSLSEEIAGNQIIFRISKSILMSLKQVTQNHGVSLFNILFTNFGLLLAKNYNLNNLLIRTNIDERIYSPNHSDVFGCLINNIFLPVNYDFNLLLIELTKVVQVAVYEAINNALPYNEILDLDRTKVAELSRIQFNLETEDITQNSRGYQQTQIYANSGKIKNDLYFELDAKSDQIIARVEYNSAIFTPEFIENLVSTYEFLLEQYFDNLYKPAKDIHLINQEKYNQLVYDFNLTKKAYPEDKLIHQLFEEQVVKTPNNAAVIYKDVMLTYQELNQHVNQLASYLYVTYQIKGDDLIVVCLDRSEYMLITILAILKSGAAYVPVDPTYPDDRIRFILDDTRAKVILTSHLYERRISQIAAKDNLLLDILAIDDHDTQLKLNQHSNINLEVNISSRNLAYVIYTSGTTGRPKGVMLEHKGIVNRILWMNAMYPLGENDRILQKTPYVFDVSVWEIFWANWFGAAVVFAIPDGHKDTNYLFEVIKQQNITILHFVPSMLSIFHQSLEEILTSNNSESQLPSLRYMFCSGEALNLWQVKTNWKLLPHVQVHNLYGPTEASIDVLYYDCSSHNLEHMYIGKPIWNTSSYVLDNNLHPLPLGAIGELYIGGIGLARGYLNLPELTLEKFIPNPFQSKDEFENGENVRLYKTGDLVRMAHDGSIEYIGRNDAQVKIRGYRIELSEIENKLMDYSGVKQVVVLARKYDRHGDINSVNLSNTTPTDDKLLIAYYVSDFKLDEDKILSYLTESLPIYMLPSILVYLEQLPLTINGKLDRGKLPQPEFARIEHYIAPRNEYEKQACEVYAKILGLNIETLGVKDDFFKLGGNSILIVQAIIEFKKRNLGISLKDFYENSVVEKLIKCFIDTTGLISTKFEADANIYYKNLSQEYKVQAIYPATKIQQKIIQDFQKLCDEAYCLQYCYELVQVNITESCIVSIESLVQNTQMFRTFFIKVNGEDIYQAIRDRIEFKINVIEILDTLESFIAADRVKKFNVFSADELLIRINILKSRDQKMYLYVCMHHAIIDGWSNVLFLNAIYNCVMYPFGTDDVQKDLSDKLITEPFYQYCLLEKTIIQDNEYANFWNKSLEGYIHNNQMFATRNYYNKAVTQVLELNNNFDSESKALLNKHTKNFFILNYMKLLAELFNQCDMCIGVVTNTRYDDIENSLQSMGMHWNLSPIRLNFGVAENHRILLDEMIKNVDSKFGRYPLPCILDNQDVSELFFATFKYIDFYHEHDQVAEKMKSAIIVDLYGYPINFTVIKNRVSNTYTLRIDYMTGYFSFNDIQTLLDSYSELLKNAIKVQM